MANQVSHKIFYSKLLLFGEHIINKGAMGLAIPFDKYDGVFKFGSTRDWKVRESNKSLESLANHIIYTPALATQYDTNQILEDIERGLYFDSNIPQGYGLGSSGALAAAVYHQYYKFKKKTTPLTDIKQSLALLESHYHGKSSGLDALVCYLNKAVIINNGEVTEAFNLKKAENPAIKVFLINTHIERSTSPFVNLFLEKCKDKKFMNTITESMVPSNNVAINSFLQHNYADLWKSVKVISQLQMDLIPEFIPKPFHEAFKRGLTSDQFSLKICGAGGGGYIIGFAKADADLGMLTRGLDTTEVLQF